MSFTRINWVAPLQRTKRKRPTEFDLVNVSNANISDVPKLLPPRVQLFWLLAQPQSPREHKLVPHMPERGKAFLILKRNQLRVDPVKFNGTDSLETQLRSSGL